MKIVIFCGGFGTRMWPASRKSFPKQFYPMVRGNSFFQNSVRRFKKAFKASDIIVSTEEKYIHFIKDQAPDIPVENIIVEPERRDLLGAVGLIAAVIEKRFPGEVMFFSWSDHIIEKEDKFLKAVKVSIDYTQKTGVPVSINEKPTFPSVHNGWLEQGKKVGTHKGKALYGIKRFIEKPNLEKAKKFMKSDGYLIHTGYGAWRSDQMLSYFEKYRPLEHKGLLKIMDAYGTKKYKSVLKKEYHKFEKVSVEKALFEKLPSDLRLNIPVSTGWKDAGTWQLYYEAIKEKGEHDVIEGDVEVVQLGSFKNLILGGNKKVISIIGLKNVVVIDTEDALLICDMDNTQRVKEVFKQLEENKPKYID